MGLHDTSLPSGRAARPAPPSVAKHGLKPCTAPALPRQVAGRRGRFGDGPRRPTPAAEVPGTAARLRIWSYSWSRLRPAHRNRVSVARSDARITGPMRRRYTSQRRDPGAKTASARRKESRHTEAGRRSAFIAGSAFRTTWRKRPAISACEALTVLVALISRVLISHEFLLHPVSVDPVPLKLLVCPAPDTRQLLVAADLIKLIDLIIIEIMLGRFL